MPGLLSTYGSRADVEPIAGFAVPLVPLGAEATESNVPIGSGVMPIRGWR